MDCPDIVAHVTSCEFCRKSLSHINAQKGGSSKSEAKAQAARENGRLAWVKRQAKKRSTPTGASGRQVVMVEVVDPITKERRFQPSGEDSGPLEAGRSKMTELRKDWSINSPEWAYNQPGWKPLCVRCQTRKNNCRKFNSEENGVFAGEWICAECKKDSDVLTPAERVGEKK